MITIIFLINCLLLNGISLFYFLYFMLFVLNHPTNIGTRFIFVTLYLIYHHPFWFFLFFSRLTFCKECFSDISFFNFFKLSLTVSAFYIRNPLTYVVFICVFEIVPDQFVFRCFSSLLTSLVSLFSVILLN